MCNLQPASLAPTIAPTIISASVLPVILTSFGAGLLVMLLVAVGLWLCWRSSRRRRRFAVERNPVYGHYRDDGRPESIKFHDTNAFYSVTGAM
jgi:ABC-type nickel/cobalt efflux system permease component RcnA